MSAVPVGLFLLVGLAVVVVASVLAVVFGLRTRRRREDDWQALAARRGLAFAPGDPLGLGDDLRSQVVMTVHGRHGTRPVALVGHRDPTVDDTGSTTPAAVAWTAVGEDLGAFGSDRLSRIVRSPRHGDLAVVRSSMRMRTQGSTATAAEAEATFDDLLRRLPR